MVGEFDAQVPAPHGARIEYVICDICYWKEEGYLFEVEGEGEDEVLFEVDLFEDDALYV